MQAQQDIHQFSTRDIPPGLRQQVWREQASKAFVELDVSFDGEDDCRGHLSKSKIGNWACTEISSSRSIVKRQSSAIRRSDADCFLLSLQLEGSSTIIQDNRRSDLGEGDIVIYDTTRPYELILNSPNTQLVFEIPRSDCERSMANHQQLTAAKVKPSDDISTSYHNTLLSVLQTCDANGTDPKDLVSALDLLALLYSDEADCAGIARPLNSSLRLMSIRHYVLANIADPALSQASVAAKFGISRRYLNRLFEKNSSSFANWLRDERLTRCYEELGDSRCNQFSILDIACKWGFNDAAHFSRTFKKRYLLTPVECRRSMTAK